MSFFLNMIDMKRYEQQGIIYPIKLWDDDEKLSLKTMIENCYIHQIDKFLTDRTQHQTCPELIDLLKRKQVIEPLMSLLGDNLLVWRTAFFCKEPLGENQQEIPWHQDIYNWPITPLKACTLWLAVDDVDESNGCMSVILGSHKEAIEHIPSDEGHSFSMQATPEKVDRSKAEKVCLKSGEFAIFDEKLLHASPINFSSRRRCALAIRVIPNDVKILTYDCNEQGLIVLKGEGDPNLNRIIEVTPRLSIDVEK